MKNLFPKGGALVILFLLALAFIVNSCRKDISVSQAGQEQDPKVAAAKSWYEDAYPVSITGQKLQTNSTEAPDLSQKVKPDWQHTANYSRFDEDVIEMPIDPESKYAATLQRTDGSHAYTKTYTRSSFLLLKGDKGYEAYLMTIVGDSSYIKNNPAKLANNSYRQRDSDFTGVVLYFTPKGRYVSGYRYNNGQLVVPQTGEKQSNCVIANSQHTNAVIRPNTLHCLDWYMVTSQNGIIINVEYLYRTCSDDGACISGGGGGSSGAPPPPTPCPGGGSPGTPPVVQPTATQGGHVKVNSIPNGSGFPPPSGGSGCNLQPLPVNPPADAAVKNQIKDKPFALYDIPCEVIKKWLSTAKFTPDNTIISKLNSVTVNATTSLGTGAPGFTSTDVAHVQKIDDAFSSVVNMDYFPVTVSQLPIVNGQRLTPDQFLKYIRTNINNFINDSKTFIPYNYNGIDDRAKWNSNDPKGALVAIDLAGPDNATVITSYAANDRWTFTTIYDPAYAGEHPVSGNRNFGYTANADGSYTFYTRGVDRLTSWEGVLMQNGPELLNEYLGVPVNGVPFTMADKLWKSFQSGITDFVKNNGGNAKVDQFETYRPNWDLVKEVLEGKKPLSSLSKDCPN